MRVMRVQVVVKAGACALSIVAIVLEIVSVLSGNPPSASNGQTPFMDLIEATCTDNHWAWWWSGPGLCDGTGCGS